MSAAPIRCRKKKKKDIARLVPLLESLGLCVTISPYLLAEGVQSPEEKAKSVNIAFCDPAVDAVLDVSGDDLANTVLPFMVFDAIGKSKALYFVFSDLTVILNAIMAKAVYANNNSDLIWFLGRI